MPLQATSGAASYDAFGGGVPVIPEYIEDMFSTYLYTGNDSTQTITNGIDLAGKGGMVFVKGRDIATGGAMIDTVRGVNKNIVTNQNYAQDSDPSVSAFNSNGFSINSLYSFINDTGNTYVSWTFRKQPKFFDIVTYTGTGSNTTIAHSLGSVPACIIVKRTNTSADWQVYHRSLANTEYLVLNSTAAKATGATRWNSTTPTSSVFSLGTDASVNASGSTYVAYLFAHNAGGFGLTGTDNVISCGSYTGTGGAVEVNVGFEPQWIMFKSATAADNWRINDVMRGIPTGGADANLAADLSNAEYGTDNRVDVTATGFIANASNSQASETHIYIAIRRGPMKVPTVGTSVFSPEIGLNASTNGLAFDAGFVTDFLIRKYRPGDSNIPAVSRLTGDQALLTTTTGAEYTETYASKWDSMLGVLTGTAFNFSEQIGWTFRRAPSFFDMVCYTGTGIDPTTFSHNLTVIPELLIIKRRSGVSSWPVFYNFVGSTFDKLQGLNQTGGAATGQTYTGGAGLGGAPTATTFTTDNTSTINGSGSSLVAYLFATCAGVSKVGSYTGTGTTKQIDCGFTAGARFVLIKKTSDTGSWYIWDSARGIVSGNDPYLLLNSTAAEVTNTDYIDTYSAGFEISSTAPSEINENGGSFIFLAIA